MARIATTLACAAFLYGAEKAPPKPREENLSPEKFAEIHGGLLGPEKKTDPARLTEQVARALPAAQPGKFELKTNHYIDRQIFGKMRRDGIPHAGLASDAEFLRRASLDLTGRIPTAADVREFEADRNPAKRGKAVDRLLESDAFVEKWAYFFMDLFRANGKMGRGQNLFHYWMKENLRVDRPYDDVARDIIAASAKSNHVVAAASVIAREHVQGKPQPDHGKDLDMVQQLDTHDELAVLYSKVFLGVNTSCIACHDGKGHLEKVNVWLSQRKRHEFFKLASFMGNSRYLMYWENGKPQSGEFLIDDHAKGYDTRGASMIRVPRFGGPNTPAFILTGETPKPGAEPRVELGRMLTSHPQFARAAANMFWKQMMGQGIVEPFDEFDLARQDPANVPKGWDLQPTHPGLLEELAADFRKDHSVKRMVATIAKSNVYQLSARFDGEWKDSYSKYFARKFARMLSAEELHDSIALATGRPGNFKLGDLPMNMAMQLSGPQGGGDIKYFMQTFGQSNRNNPPRPLQGSPLQPLLLMQSPVVNDRVLAQKDSKVQRLLDSYKDDAKVVDEMFVSTLARRPSAHEHQVALAALAKNRVEGAQNLQWSLINLTEFFFNY